MQRTQLIRFMGLILLIYAKIIFMQVQAKILFYNQSDGNGIVITRDHEKFPFNVAGWDDFDQLPQAGMNIHCKIENGSAVAMRPIEPLPQEELSKNIQAQDKNIQQTSRQESTEHDEEENSLALWERNRVKIDQIRMSVSVAVCVEQYFKQIDEDINRRTGYKSAKYRLDYLRMRRFLFTMYNNLTELDTHFVTPRIKAMRDDLLQMSSVYDDFKSKATFPEIAFEKVFLNRQEEYVRVRNDAEVAHAELSGLRGTEERLSEIIEEKEETLERTLRVSTQFDRLDEEHKELKSNYVDTVHNMASLDEAYRHDMEIMMAFEKQHKDEFFDLFNVASEEYRSQIIHILDAQAYLFDEQLWMQAQKSKVIQKFFKDSHIRGDYSSKTFLHYYLNSLDEHKISDEQRELFKLYKYLESIKRDVVVVIAADMDDAFYFKSLFAKLLLPLEYQVFIETKKAFSWMQKHRVSLLIVDEQLDKISGESFVKQFQDKVGSRCKLALLSHDGKAVPKPFHTGMSRQIRAGLFKEQIEILLKEDNG
jgi:hypothetical protein